MWRWTAASGARPAADPAGATSPSAPRAGGLFARPRRKTLGELAGRSRAGRLSESSAGRAGRFSESPPSKADSRRDAPDGAAADDPPRDSRGPPADGAGGSAAEPPDGPRIAGWAASRCSRPPRVLADLPRVAIRARQPRLAEQRGRLSGRSAGRRSASPPDVVCRTSTPTPDVVCRTPVRRTQTPRARRTVRFALRYAGDAAC